MASGFLKSYSWLDTRDMVADGLTKGSVDRTALASIMDGRFDLVHDVHEYVEPKVSRSSDGSDNHNYDNNVHDVVPSRDRMSQVGWFRL